MSENSLTRRTVLITLCLLLITVVEGLSYAQTQSIIVNSSSRPVMVRDVDSSSHEPIQRTVIIQGVNGQLNQSVPFIIVGGRSRRIPPGKRLVIEYISVQSEQKYCDSSVCDVDVLAVLHTRANDMIAPYYIPLIKIGVFDAQSLSGNHLTGTIRHASQLVKIYGDSETDVIGQVIIAPTIQGYANGQNIMLQMTISGYLEDVELDNESRHPHD